MKKLICGVTALFVLCGCGGVAFKKTDNGLSASFTMKNVNSVSFYGSCNDFSEIKAAHDGDRWMVNLPYTEKMTYFITADGVQTLPDCDMKEYDDFGGQLCVYEVEK